MAIGIYGAAKGTNLLIEFDVRGLATDEGAAIRTPFFESAEWSAPGGEGKLRRLAQVVHLNGDNTITLTPIADTQAAPSQAEAFVLAAADGVTQSCESGPALDGARFGMRVTVTSYGGGLEFGEADAAIISKRASGRA